MRIQAGIRAGGRALGEADRLIRKRKIDTVILGVLLALLPSLVRGVFSFAAHEGLLRAWITFLRSFSEHSPELLSLLEETVYLPGVESLAAWLVSLCLSLFLTPLLLSSLSLLYTGASGEKPLGLLRTALRNAKSLVLVALLTALAAYMVNMLPSMLVGLISAVTGFLSLFPFLSGLMSWLNLLLIVIIFFLADLLVTVLFAFVYIAVACEGASGIRALARSFSLVREMQRIAVWPFLLLSLARYAALALLVILYAALDHGIDVIWLYAACIAVNAAFAIPRTALSAALYLGNQTGRTGAVPPLSHLKRANVDE